MMADREHSAAFQMLPRSARRVFAALLLKQLPLRANDADGGTGL